MVLSCLTPSPADTVILQLRTVVTDQESVMDCGTTANTPKYRIVGESQPESVHVAAVAALARNVTRGTDIGRTRLTASAGGPVASFARSMRKTTRRKKKTSKAGDVGTNGLQCKTCKRVFLYAGNLKSHGRVHSGERPFGCNQCSKTFSQKGNLKTHLLTHSGERPHGCSKCTKSFTQIGNLRAHQLIHSDKRPHECVECGKNFRQKSALKEHQRHRIEGHSRCSKPKRNTAEAEHLVSTAIKPTAALTAGHAEPAPATANAVHNNRAPGKTHQPEDAAAISAGGVSSPTTASFILQDAVSILNQPSVPISSGSATELQSHFVAMHHFAQLGHHPVGLSTNALAGTLAQLQQYASASQLAQQAVSAAGIEHGLLAQIAQLGKLGQFAQHSTSAMAIFAAMRASAPISCAPVHVVRAASAPQHVPSSWFGATQ